MKFTVLSLFVSIACYSQSKTAKGLVFDELTQKPIPYVNISILESKFGISSEDDGTYLLEIEEKDFDKKVHMSSLGYKDSIISVENLIKQHQIFLKPIAEQLNEVVISKKFEENFLIVNSRKRSGVYGMGMSETISLRMMALFFPFQEEYSQTKNLHSIKIHVKNKSYFSPKPFPSKFRVRLFSIGIDGLPDEDLISESILVETVIKQKMVEIDISKHNLIFPNEGFYVALEWLFIPFNEYVDTYRTKTEKKHKELRYAPRFSVSIEKPGAYKTALFVEGKWIDFSLFGMTRDEVIIPAISLTLSN